jgi:hypothetical protein
MSQFLLFLQFFALLGKNPQLVSALDWKQGTLFAPTNQALNEHEKDHPGQFNNFTLLYHFSNREMPYFF